MKNLAFTMLLCAVIFSAFGQVSKYPPKAIGIFLGEKHPEFDESKFPNMEFYYVIKKNYKNPEGMLQGINEGTNLLFDKNGVLIAPLKYAQTESELGKAFSYMKRNKVVTDGQELDITPLDDYAQTHIKKGKVLKAGKKIKSKNPDHISDDYITFNLPDFKLTDAAGKEYSFNSLVNGNPLTLVVFQYLDLWNESNAKTFKDQMQKLEKINDGI